MTPLRVVASKVLKRRLKTSNLLNKSLVLENCNLSLKNPWKVLEICLSESQLYEPFDPGHICGRQVLSMVSTTLAEPQLNLCGFYLFICLSWMDLFYHEWTFSIMNRPFYRYGGHIELIRFKEYYICPRGMSTIRYTRSSVFMRACRANFSLSFLLRKRL